MPPNNTPSQPQPPTAADIANAMIAAQAKAAADKKDRDDEEIAGRRARNNLVGGFMALLFAAGLIGAGAVFPVVSGFLTLAGIIIGGIVAAGWTLSPPIKKGKAKNSKLQPRTRQRVTSNNPGVTVTPTAAPSRTISNTPPVQGVRAATGRQGANNPGAAPAPSVQPGRTPNPDPIRSGVSQGNTPHTASPPVPVTPPIADTTPSPAAEPSPVPVAVKAGPKEPAANGEEAPLQEQEGEDWISYACKMPADDRYGLRKTNIIDDALRTTLEAKFDAFATQPHEDVLDDRDTMHLLTCGGLASLVATLNDSAPMVRYRAFATLQEIAAGNPLQWRLLDKDARKFDITVADPVAVNIRMVENLTKELSKLGAGLTVDQSQALKAERDNSAGYKVEIPSNGKGRVVPMPN